MQSENVAKDRNTGYQFISNYIGNGDPMHEVWTPHRIPRGWKRQS